MTAETKHYHIQIKYVESQKSGFGNIYENIKTEQEFDLSIDEINEIGKQYLEGCIFFKGKWVDTALIKEIEIRESPTKTTDGWNYSSSVFQSTIYPIVTRRFIKSQPKQAFGIPQTNQLVEKESSPKNNQVFIVHGNDHAPMIELKTMLYELGLNPIVLHEQPSGCNTLVEKLERYSNVDYAFVMLTPDDIGGSAKELEQSSLANLADVENTLKKVFRKRARQNVVLEFGYFISKLGRSNVCCLHKGNVELPSDMQGIMYLPFINSVEEVRYKIMKELTDAKFKIKM